MLNADIATLSGCNLIRVCRKELGDAFPISSGSYFFYIQNWRVDGIRKVNELHYYVAGLESGEMVDRDVGEQLMVAALLHGMSRDIGSLGDEEFARAQYVMQSCVNTAFSEFDEFSEGQKSQNRDLIVQQRLYVDRVASKKLSMYDDTIHGLLVSGKKAGVVNMWRGKADKVRQDRDMRLKRLEEKFAAQATVIDVATGIVKLED